MKYLLIPIALSLTACATTDYESYAKSQSDIAVAKSNADTARYNALSKIAETGDGSAKIAAVMALALGNSTTSTQTVVQAPQASNALQWASILVPSLTNIAGLHYANKTSMATAEYSARIAESTNSTFSSIAGKIQAPVSVLPQANVTTTSTTTTSTDNHAVSTTTANPTTTTTTLSGTGTLGSGAYSTQANPVTTTTTSNPVTTTTTTTNPATSSAVCGVSVTGTVNCIP